MAGTLKRSLPIATVSGWDVVLGGSDGIGFAFAKRLAELRRRVVLVSRGRERLHDARKRLLSCGASDVRVVSGDLLDPRFRTRMFQGLSELTLSTIFIGGPSPAAGRIDQVSGADIHSAAESCVAYPTHVMQLLIAHHSPDPIWVVFLSSAASKEKLPNHPFFLSAVFRPETERLLKRMAKLPTAHRIRLSVWHPKVVYTRLAQAYARGLPPIPTGDSLEKRLRVCFCCDHVPSPAQYVGRVIKSAHGIPQ